MTPPLPTDATSYDRIPYASAAFPQTHPDRLATVARLFGLEPADVASCRVLELGCASGGNLIPMACNLPRSQFVGIDLSRRQVDDGHDAVRALGLDNIRIEHASILDVTPEWGSFDYIICHGVFSWVEAAVQDHIFRILRDNLARAGVAYVSYNTYPGWHMREMVRHMMRYHAGQFEEPREQIEQARALLTFVTSASKGTGPYGELLGQEADRLRRASDSYLFHEHLEQTNSPLYFHQFIERAERAGLLYLSEASVGDMLTSHFPPEVADTLERISPDLLHLEQYMDFVRNRPFRQTLLCRDDQKPVRRLSTGFLARLLLSSSAAPETHPVDLSRGRSVVFWSGKRRADVSLPATKAAFGLLSDAWPCALSVAELGDEAIRRASPHLDDTPIADVRHSLLGDLFGAIMYGMVEMHTSPLPCVRIASDLPRAHPLAAFHARRGGPVVNARHETVELGDLALEVLALCDGRRSRSDMVDALLARWSSGRLVLDVDGNPVTDAEAARSVLVNRIESALQVLARSAVLEA